MRQLLRPFVFVLIFVVATVCCCVQSVLGMVGASSARRYVQIVSYRAALRLWGIRLQVDGALADGPALLVANHCSYVDIPVLGAVGSMRFTPKSDVRSWPLIGLIPPAYDVIFVDRVPGKAKKAQADLLDALHAGDRICVFPEGTTNDGRHLKPFKATLFSLAEQWDGDAPLHVQPVTVCYESIDGRAMDDALWDRVAWFGDTDLLSHMWAFAALRNIRVRVLCHDPLMLHDGEGRKQLSERARAQILTKLPHLQENA